MEKNVLIIDDKEDMVFILEREFRRKSDYSIWTASTPQQAWEHLQNHPISMIISDVRLNGESGFDLIAVVLKNYPEVGVIMMSAYHSTANLEQANALGVFLFIEKPFSVSRLIEQIDGYYLKKELAATAAASPATSAASDSMDHFSLQDLIQLFCLNGRSVSISLQVEQDIVGVLYIQRGRIQHAYYDALNGDAAVLELFTVPKARLIVAEAREEVFQTVTSDWHHLLLLGAVKIDERKRLANPSSSPVARLG